MGKIYKCVIQMYVYSSTTGEPKDAGILPRALDVLFNSISNKQCHSMNLKPKMFTDVVKLSPDQVEYERKIKEKTLKLSNEEVTNIWCSLSYTIDW